MSSQSQLIRRSLLIAVLAALVGISLPTAAKDFRALDFQDDCEASVALERSLGSTPQDVHGREDMRAFEGFFEGIPAQIIYICQHGKLVKGMYMFDRNSFAEVAAVYSSLKPLLVRTYGHPSFDAASSEAQERMRALGVARSEKDSFLCVWNDHNLAVTLSIIGPGGGWRAVVVVEES